MVFRSPQYYAKLKKFRKEQELRKLRNNSDQAISDEASTGATSVRPDPGLNLLADSSDPVHGQQPPLESGATSFKQQATKPQASSGKHQAPSNKRQASSRKQQAPQ